MRMLLRLATLLCLSLTCAGSPAQTTDVKITFAGPLATPPWNFHVEHESFTQPTPEYKPRMSFSELIDHRITAIHVTMMNADRFKTQAEAETLLRAMLTSNETHVYNFHVWSWMDGPPSLVATVDHGDAKPGQLVLWQMWDTPYWAYQDEQGRVWWVDLSSATLTLSAPETVVAGEPIRVHLRLQSNTLQISISDALGAGIELDPSYLIVSKAAGQRLAPKPFEIDGSMALRGVQPGETLDGFIRPDLYYDLSQPGLYGIQLRWPISKEHPDVTISSNIVHLRVLPAVQVGPAAAK